MSPEAEVWRRLEYELGAGLIHGQRAVDLLCVRGVNRSPADAAALLTDMVEAGVLAPCKYDPAGAIQSVRTFRSLQNLRSRPVLEWCSGDAHFWTYIEAKNKVDIV